jgi:hypothetical protein
MASGKRQTTRERRAGLTGGQRGVGGGSVLSKTVRLACCRTHSALRVPSQRRGVLIPEGGSFRGGGAFRPPNALA